MKLLLPSTLLLLTTLSSFCQADNIVVILTCSSYSHRLVHWPLIESLISAGHNLTFIGPFGPSPEMTNPLLREIQPAATTALMSALIDNNFDVNHRAEGLTPPLYMVLDQFCFMVCQTIVESPEIKEWLANDPKVDLVISDMMPECGYGFAQKLKAKHILYVPIPMVTRHFEAFGMNPETNWVPDYDFSKKVPLSFLNRVFGAILPLWYMMKANYFYYFKYMPMFEKEFGLGLEESESFSNLTQAKKLEEAYELTNLIMINGDFISDYPRSYPSFVVKVPGIHLKDMKDLKPLDKDVEDFVAPSNKTKTEGFIYISFGTVARAPNLPLELRQLFFTVIKSFPNVKFVWKWDGENPEEDSYPKNLKLVKWVEQQRILAHPNIRAFLTQAGRPSMQEAIHNGVPTITFPVLADQDFNADRLENLGAGIGLDFVGLTEEKLSAAISSILTDSSYKERAVSLSRMSQDVLVPPVKTAHWWVEFVLRYTPQELSVMKPLSRQQFWYEKRELDVWLFLLLSLSTLLYVIYKISLWLLVKIFNIITKTTTTNKVKTS